MRVKEAHAIRTEDVFKYIVGRASSRGMHLDEDKTTVLCISDNVGMECSAYIKAGGEKIKGSPSLKFLGFTFSPDPNPNVHVTESEGALPPCVLRQIYQP